MIKVLAALLAFGIVFGAAPRAVDACAGLIGSNGAVNLGRTTTLAAYHDGVEHYVTSFEFPGGGGEFGTLDPAARRPDQRRARRRLDAAAPRPARRGRSWRSRRPTRLGRRACGRERRGAASRCASTRSTSPCSRAAAPSWRRGLRSTASGSRPTRPRCSTSTPSAARSSSRPCSTATPRWSAARPLGDGTPVHLTIPTDNPWVPLRILGLGKQADDAVERRRLPADRRACRRSCRSGSRGLSIDYSRRRQQAPARRPALRRRHGVGAAVGLADQARHRHDRAVT